MILKIISGFCIFIVVFLIIFSQISKSDCLVGKWTDCSKNQRTRIITPNIYGSTCSLDTTQYCSNCVIGSWTDCSNNQKTRIIIPAINGGTCTKVDTTQACDICFGNEGGRGGGVLSNRRLGGGGGGAGDRGADAHDKGYPQANNASGVGGIGKECNITGTNVYYAGGGGGGNLGGTSANLNSETFYNDGGLGGGGRSGTNTVNPVNGTDELGGGGGGDGYDRAAGANGGSGIVILRYIMEHTLI